MKKISLRFFGIGALTFSVGSAFAGGIEKSTTWSGRYMGIGGAAVSSVEGAESLYFNPANLTTSQGAEVSLNLSGIWPKFSAPFTSSNPVDGERGLKPAFGAFVSYPVTDKFVVGIGAYAAGGAKANYPNVNLSGVTLLTGSQIPTSFSPTFEADLSLIEYSIGAGYEIMDDVRIGAAWRVMQAKATIGTIFPVVVPGPGVSFANAIYDELSATRYNGFRVGVSYSPRTKPYGFGATWRSSVSTNVSGTSSGKIAGVGAFTGGPVTVGNTLPYQITIGGHYEIIPRDWKVLIQYDFTNYQTSQAFVLGGTISSPGLFGSSMKLPNITQQWTNMSVLRVGSEYMALRDVTLRAAYVLTGQTTPATAASPLFYAPGIGNTFVIGAGNHTWIKNLSLNVAAEYSINSGTGPAVLSSVIPGKPQGKFSENDFAFHLGATYQL